MHESRWIESDMVKQEMARLNIDILGISELNGLEWANLTQMTIICTTVGKNPLEEMQYLGAISKAVEWSWFISKTNHLILQ